MPVARPPFGGKMESLCSRLSGAKESVLGFKQAKWYKYINIDV